MPNHTTKKFWRLSTILLGSTVLSSSTLAAELKKGFTDFKTEIGRAKKSLPCSNGRLTPADELGGALFGCIKGTEETAKYWINEEPGRPGVVGNIKVMWNDWHRHPEGRNHSDREKALGMVRALAHMYVPSDEARLIEIFQSPKHAFYLSGAYSIEYSLSPGPGIDEHLLVVQQIDD
jgi:hypothetical protein